MIVQSGGIIIIKEIGIKGNLLNWIKEWLKGRK